jgi:hypothetical protein
MTNKFKNHAADSKTKKKKEMARYKTVLKEYTSGLGNTNSIESKKLFLGKSEIKNKNITTQTSDLVEGKKVF